MNELTNKELVNHDIYSQYVSEKMKQRLLKGKGSTKNQIQAISDNLNQQYFAEWNSDKKRWIISGKRESFTKKENGRGKSDSLLYKEMAVAILSDNIKNINSVRKYTALQLLAPIFFEDIKSFSDLKIVVTSTIKNNQEHFKSFLEVNFAGKKFSQEVIDTIIKRDIDGLIQMFTDDLNGRAKYIFREACKQNDIKYVEYFTACKGINDFFSIKKEVYEEYSEFKKGLEHIKNSAEKTVEIEKQFNFRFAFRQYSFLDNSHIENIDYTNSDIYIIRKQLFDRIMQRVPEKNTKIESYEELANKLGKEQTAIKMVYENLYFKLRRHRELETFFELVYKKAIFNVDIEIKKAMTEEELQEVDEAMASYFAELEAETQEVDESKPLFEEEKEQRKKKSIRGGKKHTETMYEFEYSKEELKILQEKNELASLKNTIKNIFEIDEVPLKSINRIAAYRNGEEWYSLEFAKSLGRFEDDEEYLDYLKSKDMRHLNGKRAGYSYKKIEEGFVRKKDDIIFQLKNKDFDNIENAILYIFEIVQSDVEWVESGRKLDKQAEAVADSQMKDIVTPSFDKEYATNALDKYKKKIKKKKVPRFF